MKFQRVTSTGYIYDNRIFLVAVLMLLGIVGYIVATQGLTPTPYFRCNADTCKNAILDKSAQCSGVVCSLVQCNEPWCTQEYLPRGEYGKRPLNTSTFAMFAVFLFVLAFAVNHQIFNKNKKFDLGLDESPLGKLAKRFKKVEDSDDKRE